MPDESARPRPSPLRWLMWAHLVFLISLPFLALIASGQIRRGSPVGTLLWGFVPGVVFSTAIAASYRMPATFGGALLLVLGVPAQIALSAVLFDAGPWAFLIEEAFVEVGSLCFGIAVAMFIYRPTGGLGVAVGAVMIGGSAFAYLPALLRAYEGAHPGWYVLLATSFLTSALFHLRVFADAAREFVASGVPQVVPLRYGGGFLARFLGLDRSAETIGPDLDHDRTTVVILIFVGVYVLGGMAVCVLTENQFGK